VRPSAVFVARDTSQKNKSGLASAKIDITIIFSLFTINYHLLMVNHNVKNVISQNLRKSSERQGDNWRCSALLRFPRLFGGETAVLIRSVICSGTRTGHKALRVTP
jgi:hypothetical protein